MFNHKDITKYLLLRGGVIYSKARNEVLTKSHYADSFKKNVNNQISHINNVIGEIKTEYDNIKEDIKTLNLPLPI